MCLKPQIAKDQKQNTKERHIRSGRGVNDRTGQIRRSGLPRIQNRKNPSSRRRRCLRFRGSPRALRRCRIRNGLGRLKRETNENNYSKTIFRVNKVKCKKDYIIIKNFNISYTICHLTN